MPKLDQVLEQAQQTPLSDPDYQKLKDALHLLVGLLTPARSTEKTSTLLAERNDPSALDAPSAERSRTPPPGHGHNGVAAFTGAQKIMVAHADLQSGQGCPAGDSGKVYHQKEPKPLVRLVGQAPVAATVYELERLRCNTCGQVFTATEPEGVGAEQYDETMGAMMAQLKYGSGVPFYRLEKLQASLGIPLPASTLWEMAEESAELPQPAWQELIRQGAQGKGFCCEVCSGNKIALFCFCWKVLFAGLR